MWPGPDRMRCRVFLYALHVRRMVEAIDGRETGRRLDRPAVRPGGSDCRPGNKADYTDRIHGDALALWAPCPSRVKTADLNIRISPRLKEAARKAAEMDQRTLSSLIERLLTEHCRRAGTLKGQR